MDYDFRYQRAFNIPYLIPNVLTQGDNHANRVVPGNGSVLWNIIKKNQIDNASYNWNKNIVA